GTSLPCQKVDTRSGRTPTSTAFPTRRSSDLTTETVLGPFENIEARAGRPFEELLGDWLLAHALDDHPEYSVDPLYSMPSWNTPEDRKSTRLNSSHVKISYAVFCLKKKRRHHR